MKNDWIAFSATLNGIEVRLTVGIDEIDIVTRSNGEDYDPEIFASQLKDIEFEDIY
jgi:stringent starvation protein B